MSEKQIQKNQKHVSWSLCLCIAICLAIIQLLLFEGIYLSILGMYYVIGYIMGASLLYTVILKIITTIALKLWYVTHKEEK